MSNIPLKVTSHYSLGLSILRIEDIVSCCKKLGFPACAITDYNSISGCVEFYKECKKQKIKPILGVELIVDSASCIILCKNERGWLRLISLISKSFQNDPTHIKFEDLKSVKDDCICILGHNGTDLRTNLYKKLFKDCYTNKEVALPEGYYLKEEHAEDHRAILCSGNGIKLKDLKNEIKFKRFFDTDKYWLGNFNGFNQELLSKTQEIADKCEEFDILSPPRLPKYSDNEYEELVNLCREGWKQKVHHIEDTKVYEERIKQELDVIKEAGLSGYFLIVQDFVNWIRHQGRTVGTSRGSAAGCLISYLIGITSVDPIPYNLLFSRFFNKGRGKSLPDIDIDVEKYFRADVIEYIRERYGTERVGQVATFGRLQGSGALKEVLRIHEVCDSDSINKITKLIPNEADIADKLEEEKETSTIRWILKHDPKRLRDYCYYQDNILVGDYAQYFEQAIRLEGIYKTQGKHAAGVVIGWKSLRNICPMIKDTHGNTVCGWDMDSLKEVGLVKFDLLGLVALDKIRGVISLLQKGSL